MSDLLHIYHDLPKGLLNAKAGQLAALLGGPSLIHLPGERHPPLFVSILVHGNETTGLEALQSVLRAYAGASMLPRALSCFIGNVYAAAQNRRRLNEQPDYNRIWPAGKPAASAEAAMAARVVDEMQGRGVFASIDIHNNTGSNPHYAAINAMQPHFLQLAGLFSRRVLYFTRPEGIQSMSFAKLCPAVTLECGQAGRADGRRHAAEFLQACLELATIPDAVPSADSIDVLHTVAVVRVPLDVSLGSENSPAQIRLRADIDGFNWRELPRGTLLARLHDVDGLAFNVRDNRGFDVSSLYLRREADRLLTAKPLMPAMLTRNERAIRDDCLCYFLERIGLNSD